MTVRFRCLGYRVKAQVPSSNSPPRGYSTLPKGQDGMPVFQEARWPNGERKGTVGRGLGFQLIYIKRSERYQHVRCDFSILYQNHYGMFQAQNSETFHHGACVMVDKTDNKPVISGNGKCNDKKMRQTKEIRKFSSKK